MGFKKEKLQESNRKLVMFMGARGGVGTTTFALNTAINYANVGKQVIYLDLQFDYPNAYRYLGVEDEDFDKITSMVKAINTNSIELDRMMLKTDNKNLKLLSESPKNPYAYWHTLEDGACAKLVDECINNFDVVVCDAGDNITSELYVNACQRANSIYLISEPQIDLMVNAVKKKEFVTVLASQDKLFRVIQNRCMKKVIPEKIWENAGYKLIGNQFYSKSLADVCSNYGIAVDKISVTKDSEFKDFVKLIDTICSN